MYVLFWNQTIDYYRRHRINKTFPRRARGFLVQTKVLSLRLYFICSRYSFIYRVLCIRVRPRCNSVRFILDCIKAFDTFQGEYGGRVQNLGDIVI